MKKQGSQYSHNYCYERTKHCTEERSSLFNAPCLETKYNCGPHNSLQNIFITNYENYIHIEVLLLYHHENSTTYCI